MIPFATTKITVLAPEPTRDSQDPYGDEPLPDPDVWARDVRAVIVEDLGSEVGEGDNEKLLLRLRCDPCKIDHRCVVVDQTTGARFEVETVHLYGVPPLDHLKCRLSLLNLGGENNG